MNLNSFKVIFWLSDSINTKILYILTLRLQFKVNITVASDRLKFNDIYSNCKNLEIEREPLKAVPLNANVVNISSTKENIPA